MDCSATNMEENLEEMWKKLSLTKEENKGMVVDKEIVEEVRKKGKYWFFFFFFFDM